LQQKRATHGEVQEGYKITKPIGVLEATKILLKKQKRLLLHNRKGREHPHHQKEMSLKKKRAEEEEEEGVGEEDDEEDDNDSSLPQPSVAVAKEGAKSSIKNGTAELATLTSEAAKIEAKLEVANLGKEKNAEKVKVLMKAHNEYPAEVSALVLISCFRIEKIDLRCLQDAP
jgi:hypothetical protein